MGNDEKKHYENEVDTGHGAQISENASDKLFNSIARIEIKDNKGTGFFMKTHIKGKQYKFLCTNYHVISQELVDSKTTFDIYYGKKNNETKKTIKLDIDKRFIRCFKIPKDVCIIEIIKTDKIPEDKFLFPDLNYKNGFDVYKNENFYLAGYPKVDKFIGERHISSGKITKIEDFEFNHTLDTRSGSSGSPICLINNQNIIGIHKGGYNKEHINYGTFLGIILDELEIDDKTENNKSINKTILNDSAENTIGKIAKEKKELEILTKIAEEQRKKLSKRDLDLIDEIFKDEIF